MKSPATADTAQARKTCEALLASVRSLILATVAADGEPLASVAPFVRAADGSLLIAVSGLAAHAAQIAANPAVSVMLIEDESTSRQIFARTRLTLRCRAEALTDAGRTQTFAALRGRFGEIAGVLEGLPDFLAVRLVPLSGVFVMGFGAAFRVASPDLTDLRPIRPERTAAK